MYDPKGFTLIKPEIGDDYFMPVFVNEPYQKGSGIATKPRSKYTFPKTWKMTASSWLYCNILKESYSLKFILSIQIKYRVFSAYIKTLPC